MSTANASPALGNIQNDPIAQGHSADPTQDAGDPGDGVLVLNTKQMRAKEKRRRRRERRKAQEAAMIVSPNTDPSGIPQPVVNNNPSVQVTDHELSQMTKNQRRRVQRELKDGTAQKYAEWKNKYWDRTSHLRVEGVRRFTEHVRG